MSFSHRGNRKEEAEGRVARYELFYGTRVRQMHVPVASIINHLTLRTSVLS